MAHEVRNSIRNDKWSMQVLVVTNKIGTAEFIELKPPATHTPSMSFWCSPQVKKPEWDRNWWRLLKAISHSHMLRELTLKTINTDPLHFHPRRVEIYLNSILPPFPLFSPWWPCMPVSVQQRKPTRTWRRPYCEEGWWKVIFGVRKSGNVATGWLTGQAPFCTHSLAL